MSTVLEMSVVAPTFPSGMSVVGVRRDKAALSAYSQTADVIGRRFQFGGLRLRQSIDSFAAGSACAIAAAGGEISRIIGCGSNISGAVLHFLRGGGFRHQPLGRRVYLDRKSRVRIELRVADVADSFDFVRFCGGFYADSGCGPKRRWSGEEVAPCK